MSEKTDTYLRKVLKNDSMKSDIEKMASRLNLQVCYVGTDTIELYGKEGEDYYCFSSYKSAIANLKKLIELHND